MRAEDRIPTPKTGWKVSVWKDDVDPSSPWWRKAFFKHVYLRFWDLSFKLGIPKAKEVTIESDEHGNSRRTYRWFEDISVFDHEDQADAACLTERYLYTEIPHGQSAPFDSAQLKGSVFPRKKKPRKWANPVFSLILKDRKQEEIEQQEREQGKQALAQCLNELNHVLDRR